MSKYSELDRGDAFSRRENWEAEMRKTFQWRNYDRFCTTFEEDGAMIQKWEVISHKPSENSPGKVTVQWLYFDVETGELGEESDESYEFLRGVSVRNPRAEWIPWDNYETTS